MPRWFPCQTFIGACRYAATRGQGHNPLRRCCSHVARQAGPTLSGKIVRPLCRPSSKQSKRRKQLAFTTARGRHGPVATSLFQQCLFEYVRMCLGWCCKEFSGWACTIQYAAAHRVLRRGFRFRACVRFFDIMVPLVGLVGSILPLIPVSGLIRGGQPHLEHLVDQAFELAYGGHNTRPTSSSCALPAISSCDDPATASMRRRAQNSKPTSETASRTCSGRLASQHQ